jgi:hypothetical protein
MLPHGHGSGAIPKDPFGLAVRKLFEGVVDFSRQC